MMLYCFVGLCMIVLRQSMILYDCLVCLFVLVWFVYVCLRDVVLFVNVCV